jgi:hypothetical protein
MADYGEFKFIKKDCSWWRRMTADEVRHMLAMVKPPGNPADWVAALERLEKKAKQPKNKAAKK